MEALDRHGDPLRQEIHGLTAGTYQHECDHLDGYLFLDRVEDTATLTTWDAFERFHKQDFVERARELVERLGA